MTNPFSVLLCGRSNMSIQSCCNAPSESAMQHMSVSPTRLICMQTVYSTSTLTFCLSLTCHMCTPSFVCSHCTPSSTFSGAAAASVPQPDVSWLSKVPFQQLSQCSIHVSHVTEQRVTQLQLPILPLVLAAGPLLTPSRPTGYPLHAASVCCLTYVLCR